MQVYKLNHVGSSPFEPSDVRCIQFNLIEYNVSHYIMSCSTILYSILFSYDNILSYHIMSYYIILYSIIFQILQHIIIFRHII